MFHISKAPFKSKIVVKANDTDVLIILLATIHKVPQTQIWLAGSSTKRSSKRDLDWINCTELFQETFASLTDPVDVLLEDEIQRVLLFFMGSNNVVTSMMLDISCSKKHIQIRKIKKHKGID